MDGSGTKTNDDMASLSGPKLIGRSPMCTACVNEELCTANPRPQEFPICCSHFDEAGEPSWILRYQATSGAAWAATGRVRRPRGPP